MSIYANYTGANTTFNLVRVIPAAATKTLNIGFYDVGDATAAGHRQVLPPIDANLGGVAGHLHRVPAWSTGAVPNCQLTDVSRADSVTTWNGQYENIKIPIPSTYNCTYAPGGWLLVAAGGSTSRVGSRDTTTWTASIDGDPIRLIK